MNLTEYYFIKLGVFLFLDSYETALSANCFYVKKL